MRNNRKILVAGNWKENFNVSQASQFLHRLQENVNNHSSVEVVLIPNMLTLQPLSVQIDRRKFRLGAQDGYYVDSGAFTGQVSMAMLHDIVHYVLVGHSERRHIFGEHDDLISKKMQACVRNGIMPILCVGETYEERQQGHTKQIIHNQLTAGLMHLTSREVKATVIAYEPVWAIGTGKTPKPDEIESALTYIRKQVEDLYGKQTAKHLRVIYGGSVDDQNAYSILSLEDCDGVLPGSASLSYHKFASIVDSAYKVQQKRQDG